MDRRDFLKTGALLAAAGASRWLGRSGVATAGESPPQQPDPTPKVAVRNDPAVGDVSLLGFGCMRFPRIPGKDQIDEAKAFELIDYAYRHGVNYYDTAWPYHGGQSEIVTGKALKRYPRDRILLADKMPTPHINGRARAEEVFSTQLTKCQVDYFDYYLLHNLNNPDDFERIYEKGGALAYLREEQARGRIRRLGFSYHGHGNPKFLEMLVERHPWDFIQLQINYYDWRSGQAKVEYDIVHGKNIPIVVMEPVRGGSLASLSPPAVELLKKVEPERSVASWSFRFVGTLPGILTILSGMTTMEHVVDNVATCTDFKTLSPGENTVLFDALALYVGAGTIPCTVCRYCMPCPFGVDIPQVLARYNEAAARGNIPDPNAPRDKAYDQKKRAFFRSFGAIPTAARADRCATCDRCVKYCPQHIEIPQRLAEIAHLVETLS